MSDITVTLRKDGVEYLAAIAKIESTFLGVEDHGLFTASLGLAGAGWGQAAGGMALDGLPDKGDRRRVSTAYGLDFIRKVIETLGVDSWEKVKGCSCLAIYESEYGLVAGIADLQGKQVFLFKEHADTWSKP